MEKIELAQVRDIGQTIGDCFMFLRQNLRFLFSGYLYYAVPPLLVAVAIGAFGFIKLFTNINSGFGAKPGFASLGAGLISAYGLFLLIAFFQQLYVTAFMILKEKNDEVNNADVINFLKAEWRKTLISFLFLLALGALSGGSFFLVLSSSVIFGSGVAGFLTFVLYMFLLYALLPLSNFLFIRLRENLGVFAALAQSFRIVSGQWWKTFIAMVVTFIVFYSLLVLIMIPFYVMILVIVFHAKSAGVAPNISDIYLNPVSGVLLTLGTFLLFFLQDIFYVFIGISYFSLSEKYSSFHLLGEIEQIGNRDAQNVRVQEGEF